jgi:hypothetical protein
MMRAAGTRDVACLIAALLLAGCVVRPAPPQADAHVPEFARKPYAAFSRADAVAIALREWRLFGQPRDDDPPGSHAKSPPERWPEREPGLWQRVGEYWWISQDAGTSFSLWTGRHDAEGAEFPPERDGDFAWSAAFISYVMRIAGAGPRFPYSPDHADYINVGRLMSLGKASGFVVVAERTASYAPQLGDLICFGRERAASIRFDDLPAVRFPSHCDMVVAVAPGSLAVVGGNVDDAVTMKHVPVTPEGKLARPDGTLLDARYRWFVVLRVLYDR